MQLVATFVHRTVLWSFFRYLLNESRASLKITRNCKKYLYILSNIFIYQFQIYLDRFRIAIPTPDRSRCTTLQSSHERFPMQSSLYPFVTLLFDSLPFHRSTAQPVWISRVSPSSFPPIAILVGRLKKANFTSRAKLDGSHEISSIVENL